MAPLEPQEVAAIAIPGERAKDVEESDSPAVKEESSERSRDSLNTRFRPECCRRGEEASGFFYFRTKPQPGMQLLIDGIFERPSGKEILYFEIPL